MNTSMRTRTIVALVTDFEEGVSVGGLLAEVRALAESGAHLLGLAALDDRGQPEGYLFSAYDGRTVEDVLKKL